jgi:sugar lactone lactonase YvrE
MTTARHKRFARLLFVAVAGIVLAGCLPPPLSGLGQSGTVVVPPVTGQLNGPTSNVVTGPDGNVWFVASGSYLDRMTPPGALTRFALHGFSGWPQQLARGADGAIWMTVHGYSNGQIVRISTAGAMTAYNVPALRTGNPQPDKITAGPDGNMWFTCGPAIYRITPTGKITDFGPHGETAVNIGSITAGRDAALWFTRETGNSGQPTIGRISTSGAFTYFATPPEIENPTAIVRGSDSALWFGSINGQYGRITTAGAAHIFPAPKDPTGKQIGDLTASTTTPDGSVWFAAGNGVALRVNRDGSAAAWLPAPDRMATPRNFNGIAYTSDGTLWLSNPSDPDLARISAGGALRSTIAVRGTNGALYVQHGLSGSWTNLGGQLIGRPSVLAVNGADYYFVEGSDGHPYVRTDALGWHRMSDTLRCELPVAAVWENQLNLFCGRIYDYLTPMSGPGALPTLVDGQTVIASAQGPSENIEAPALLGGLFGGAHAWATTTPAGVPQTTYTDRNPHMYWEATPLSCAHAPAARVSGATLYLACVNGAHQLQYVTSAGGAGPWSRVHTVPVVTGTGNPGLIAVPDGSVLAVLTNLDGTVTESQLTTSGGTLQATMSGSASPGVGADGP